MKDLMARFNKLEEIIEIMGCDIIENNGAGIIRFRNDGHANEYSAVLKGKQVHFYDGYAIVTYSGIGIDEDEIQFATWATLSIAALIKYEF